MKDDKHSVGVNHEFYEVICEENFLSQKCIKECIEVFNRLKQRRDARLILRIEAKAEVKDIDILLLAYFILFKKTIPLLRIQLNLTQNRYPAQRWQEELEEPGEDSEDSEDMEAEKKTKPSAALFWKLREYGAHAGLTSGLESVFEVRYGLDENGHETDEDYYERSRQNVVSVKFMPLLYLEGCEKDGRIESENYEMIFKQKLHLVWQLDSLNYTKVNRELYSVCRNSFSVSDFNSMVEMTFYKVLRELKVLNHYLKPETINEIPRISRLQGEVAGNFYKQIEKDFIFPLKESSPIYILIFSMLLSDILSSDKSFGTIDKENKDQYGKLLMQLWNFTQELIPGIQELAKNMIEHSSNHRGVITGRVYRKDSLLEFYRGTRKEDIYKDYYAHLEQKGVDHEYFLDLNAVDDGEKGVVETLQQSLANDFLSIDQDIAGVNGFSQSGTPQGTGLNLKSFLSPYEVVHLAYQAKRAMAHLGLLFFSNLIYHNDGMLEAGSWLNKAVGRKREEVAIYCDRPVYTTKNELLPAMGTNYNILLPFNKDRKLSVFVPSDADVHYFNTLDQVQIVENLLSYRINNYDGKNKPLFEKGEHYIFNVLLEKIKIRSRKDERYLWDTFISCLPEGFKEMLETKKAVISVDVENIDWDETNIFRFLGTWELNYPTVPLLMYNISTTLFLNLEYINGLYVRNSGLPFWNDKSLMIIYHYIGKGKGRFYFTDALWGKDRAHYVGLSHIISKTHFNSVAIRCLKEENYDSKYIEEYMNWFGIFYNKINLFPFELLLNTPEDISLFEQNTFVLLQNELKINF